MEKSPLRGCVRESSTREKLSKSNKSGEGLLYYPFLLKRRQSCLIKKMIKEVFLLPLTLPLHVIMMAVPKCNKGDIKIYKT